MATSTKKVFSANELAYMCRYVEYDGPGKVAYALDSSSKTVRTKVEQLKETGEFDYYRSLGYRVEEVPNIRYRLGDGSETIFTPSQQFYLYHHIVVLGMERGVQKVARKLQAPTEAVVDMFFRLHAKQKAHQTAI